MKREFSEAAASVDAISFSGDAPVAVRCCFFGAFLVGMILFVSRTPSTFAPRDFLLIPCPGDSALSQPCDLVSVTVWPDLHSCPATP